MSYTKRVIRYCERCKSDKEFYASQTGKHSSSVCIDCTKKSANFFYQAVREKVLLYYGGNPPKCACCGELTEGFLSIDHPLPHPDGVRPDRGGAEAYRRLVKENFPPGYRILCYNCNLGSAHNNGVCPHEQEVKKLIESSGEKSGSSSD